ncbi:MAG: hypothetical protein WD226_02935 [Planctomycetota bacterium]
MLARTALEEHFGEAWPKAHERLLAAGLNIDIPILLSPWDDVQDAIAAKIIPTLEEFDAQVALKIGWSIPLMALTLENQFNFHAPIDDDQLGELETIVADVNAEMIEVARSLHIVEMAAVQRAWNSGQYERSPLTTMALPKDSTGDCAIVRVAGHGGWSAWLCVSRLDAPERDVLVQQLGDLSRRRRKLVEAFLPP